MRSSGCAAVAAAALLMSLGAGGGASAAKSWIAFSGGTHGYNQDLWIVHPDGSGLVNLTKGRGGIAAAASPTWSPGHAKIAFYSDIKGGLFVFDVKKRTLTKLAEGDLREPSWNPKSNILAVSDGRGTHSPAKSWLRLVSADGVIHDLPSFPGSAVGRDFDGRWSPDGRRLVFSRGWIGRASLYLVDATGRGLKRLTFGRRNALLFDEQASWSPTGKLIAFTRVHAMGKQASFSIYTIRSDGTGLRLAIKDGYSPAWSPDGRQIAFETDEAPAKLAIANADGTHVAQVTDKLPSYIGFGIAWCC